MNNQLLHGDALAQLRTLPENSIDAIVTDPPYGLGEIKDLQGLLAAWMRGEDGAEYQTKGFMSKSWDIVPPPALWAEALRVLKPGGHMLAFAGTRTWDMMSLSIRLAGFELRDSIDNEAQAFRWIYGQGFPKSLNLGDGKGTSLKPAWEPVLVFRKPIAEQTIAANVLAWGTGGINVDGARIEGNVPSVPQPQFNSPTGKTYNMKTGQGRNGLMSHASGRWPANVLLSHLETCTEDACAEGCVCRELGEQSGNKVGAHGGKGKFTQHTWMNKTTDQSIERDDDGTAARFFAQFRYQAKASKSERDAGGVHNSHPTTKPLALMRYLVKLVTPPGGVVLDPFAGSGTTGMAAILEDASCVLIEREAEYIPIIEARLVWACKQRGQEQQSVKPVPQRMKPIRPAIKPKLKKPLPYISLWDSQQAT